MHLSPEFGMTIKEIEADGFHIEERIEMLLSSDSPEGIAKSMGLGTIGFAQAYVRSRPDILLVLGIVLRCMPRLWPHCPSKYR